MRREIVIAVAMGSLLPFLTRADDQDSHAHHQMPETTSLNDPPIRITINPEARVSVKLGGALPPPPECGKPADLSVRIVNQGFVTARLEAQLLDAPAGVTLDFHPEPLTGVPEELRTLRITLTRPGPTDVTVSFKAHNHTPDLGGRDRVHFLVQCLQAP